MQVPLDLPALVILCGDEPAARRPELFDQEDVPQHEARLGGEVVHQVLPGAAQRFGRRHRDRKGTQALTSVLDVEEDIGGGFGIQGPDRHGMELPPCHEPDGRRVRADAHPEHLRHPGEDVLGGVGIPHPA